MRIPTLTSSFCANGARQSATLPSRASSHGTISTSSAFNSSRIALSFRGSLTSGALTRAHCFTASRAIFCHRSVFFTASLPSSLTTLRIIATGAMAAAPSSVLFCTINSILSALGSP